MRSWCKYIDRNALSDKKQFLLQTQVLSSLRAARQSSFEPIKKQWTDRRAGGANESQEQCNKNWNWAEAPKRWNCASINWTICWCGKMSYGGVVSLAQFELWSTNDERLYSCRDVVWFMLARIACHRFLGGFATHSLYRRCGVLQNASLCKPLCIYVDFFFVWNGDSVIKLLIAFLRAALWSWWEKQFGQRVRSVAKTEFYVKRPVDAK